MLSMIVVKAEVESIEGFMILISRAPRALAPPSGRTQTDIKAIRVIEEKTHRSPKTELLLKTNTVGKKVHRNIPTHETNIRFLISDLERVMQPSCPLNTGTLR